MRYIWDENPNMLIPYYLMSCYLYYHMDENILSDHEFDDLAKKIYKNWSQLKHVHKKLINVQNLKTKSSGFDLAEAEYPLMIKHAAKSWLEDCPDAHLLEVKQQTKVQVQNGKRSIFD